MKKLIPMVAAMSVLMAATLICVKSAFVFAEKTLQKTR